VLVIGVVGHLWIRPRGNLGGSTAGIAFWPMMAIAIVSYAWLAYRYLEKPLIRLSHRVARHRRESPP
jgi:peptidoglycan/LPS O-acetylase OafA/YrhL